MENRSSSFAQQSPIHSMPFISLCLNRCKRCVGFFRVHVHGISSSNGPGFYSYLYLSMVWLKCGFRPSSRLLCPPLWVDSGVGEIIVGSERSSVFSFKFRTWTDLWNRSYLLAAATSVFFPFMSSTFMWSALGYRLYMGSSQIWLAGSQFCTRLSSFFWSAFIFTSQSNHISPQNDRLVPPFVVLRKPW